MKKVTFFLTATALLGAASLAGGVTVTPGPPLSSWTDVGGRRNRHNMSGHESHTASVNYKAVTDFADRRTREICIFCHTPHNASPGTPLWGRKPTVTNFFGHYSSSTLVIDNSGVKTTSDYNEPTGSSRLCLSCHDGATALGAVLYGPEIPMSGGKTTIERVNGAYNVFNPNSISAIPGSGPGEQDATKHHHPVSFKYDLAVRDAINSVKSSGSQWSKLPDVANFPDPGSTAGPVTHPVTNPVKLDRKGYMQCTTCHNPHQNMSNVDMDQAGVKTPFWVTGTTWGAENIHDTVCKTCHTWTSDPP